MSVRLIEGIGLSLRIVQIGSYEEMNPIVRKITKKLVNLPSLVMFHCVVIRL